MTKIERLNFIDSVVTALTQYCPQMSYDVKYFVGCQFALESNFGNSRIARKYNNYCGMSLPKSRMSLNISSTGNFAQFENFETCVIDYCYWLSWNNFTYLMLFNLDLFTRHLIASHYCPESDYIDRIFILFNQLKSK